MAVAFETLTEIASFVTTTELVVLKSICLLRPRPRSTGCAQVVVSVVALAAASAVLAAASYVPYGGDGARVLHTGR